MKERMNKLVYDETNWMSSNELNISHGDYCGAKNLRDWVMILHCHFINQNAWFIYSSCYTFTRFKRKVLKKVCFCKYLKWWIHKHIKKREPCKCKKKCMNELTSVMGYVCHNKLMREINENKVYHSNKTHTYWY